MDARIRYTKEAIRNAFIELLRDKPLSKITVTAICELAEINRATFYKYYNDPFDLMSQIEAEMTLKLNHIVDKAEPFEQGQLLDILTTVLLDMQKNYDVYSVLFSEHGNKQFTKQVFLTCYQSQLTALENNFLSLSSDQKELFFYFIVQGIGGTIERWVNSGMRESPEKVAEFICQMNTVLLNEFW